MTIAEQAAVTWRGLLKVLVETPYLLLKREVDEMTPEAAAKVWSRLEPFFQGVCARASSTKLGMQWDTLARKMSLIRLRAEEAEDR